MDLLLKKIDILWAIINVNNWINVDEISDKRKTRAYSAMVIYYLKKSFGQKSMDYLLILTLCQLLQKKKKNIVYKYSKISYFKWLFMSLDELFIF